MIYFNGCSYTYGIGTDTHDTVEGCLKYCYPTIAGNLLGKEVVNQSEPASSNQRIHRSTVRYLAENTPEAVCIMWSDALRMEVFKPGLFKRGFDSGISQITPQNTNSIKDFYLREAIEGYYGFVLSQAKAALDTLVYMASIQELCEAKGIPLVQMQYKPNLERYIRHLLDTKSDTREDKLLVEQINFYINYFDKRDHTYGYKKGDMLSFETLRKDNHLPNSLYSLGHPGREAHEFMGKWFSDYLKEHDLIS